jgi:hypothetical protein
MSLPLFSSQTSSKNLLSPEESESLLRNWILEQNSSFGKLQLKDVLDFLECLKQENNTPFWAETILSNNKTTQDKHIVAKWNNSLSIARIKSLLHEAII